MAPFTRHHRNIPIPGAVTILEYLYYNNISFILLTNGGGKYESTRVTELSKKLGLIKGSETVESLRDKTILVTGGYGKKYRKVTKMCGFTNIVTSTNILIVYPSIWPFSFAVNFTSALDSQIILDLLLSKNKVLDTVSEKNGDPFFPNNSCHYIPRLGQGRFQASLRDIWDEITGGAVLERTIIGKPYPETYKYAKRALNKHRLQMLGGNGKVKKKVSRLEQVFMVGDNPESDIRNANEFESPYGTEWTSILVKTGVYNKGSKPKYAPKVIIKDILEAVEWALCKEGWNGVVD
ncbi:uncharacterized protein K444DRAFT_646873 [Hyaloscypha bicolor E]|uniref:HAD-superfamily hydrolase n=1 Tax=Hyaloscypha bicolor E TaxID=1095630 RepID=A0A2J6SQX1_9HELO|nr:uncharacterized protein K444DRAFT_646873 [Hyaloscypha bicolor E]PMD53181.1 hypothetical protein K444DRAFT_646873 [Hyaloscypha bicolor E]